MKSGKDGDEMLAGIFMIANDLEEAPRTPIVDYASNDNASECNESLLSNC